jgi:hypothetical protein
MLEPGGRTPRDRSVAHLIDVFREVDQHQFDGDFAIEHRVDSAQRHPSRLGDALEDLVTTDLFGLAGTASCSANLSSTARPALRHLALRIVRR